MQPKTGEITDKWKAEGSSVEDHRSIFAPPSRDGKAIMILSGGMDSVTLLYYLRTLGVNIAALSFNYGQRHSRELECAESICKNLNIWHSIVTLPIREFLTGSALTDDRVDVPDGHYAEPTMRATVVPNRNSIMLSVAVGMAVAENAEVVAAAFHAGDHFIYPDCRPKFAYAYNRALQAANEGFGNPALHLYVPFINIKKEDIVTLGCQLGVPYQDTWSCYRGEELHCGKCGTCVERSLAFKDAGVPDPTIYEVGVG